jgi:hypothetical protein
MHTLRTKIATLTPANKFILILLLFSIFLCFGISLGPKVNAVVFYPLSIILGKLRSILLIICVVTLIILITERFKIKILIPLVLLTIFFICGQLGLSYLDSYVEIDRLSFNNHQYYLGLDENIKQDQTAMLCECDSLGLLCKCHYFYWAKSLDLSYPPLLHLTADYQANTVKVSRADHLVYQYSEASQICFPIREIYGGCMK